MMPLFLELTQIVTPTPVPSFKPAHLQQAKANLESIQDLVASKFEALGIPKVTMSRVPGSMIVRIPALEGYEHVKPLILMGHLDIVPGDEKNPLKPIKPQVVVKGNKTYITSDGTTTLGADNKISVAIMMDAVAWLMGKHPQNKNPLPHGPIEFLFSLDEEIGCPSFKDLDTETLLKGKDIICVDDERPGRITSSLASGHTIFLDVENAGNSGSSALFAQLMAEMEANHISGDMIAGKPGAATLSKNAKLTITPDRPAGAPIPYRMTVTISGLKGGHSGLDAHHVSANTIMNRFMTEAGELDSNGLLQNAKVTTPSHKSNAINQSVSIQYDVTSPELLAPLQALATQLQGHYQASNKTDAKRLEITVTQSEVPKDRIEYKLRANQQADEDVEVQRMKTVLEGFLQRIQEKDPTVNITMVHSQDYPSWNGDPKSLLYAIARETGQTVFKKKVPLKLTHAGAQPGMISTKKNASGEFLSNGILIGAHLDDLHVTTERFHVESIEPTRNWVVAMIQQYAEKYPRS